MNQTNFWDEVILATIFAFCVVYIARRIKRMFFDTTSACQGCRGGGSGCGKRTGGAETTVSFVRDRPPQNK
ncbi:MAG: hypothetical protein HQM03_05200 [Magnetococcales bacterium]|nr:hypothetical protein [Magnetococcales bacterium]